MKEKIIGVNHINYYDQYKKKLYYFKSTGEIKKGDIVLCDTKNGAALGLVREVIDIISIDELLKSDLFPFLQRGLTIKECKLLPNYSSMKILPECELPF